VNYKRRHRRKGGIKGCCGMCMLQTTDGRRNGRIPTPQEMRAPQVAEGLAEYDGGPDWSEWSYDGWSTCPKCGVWADYTHYCPWPEMTPPLTATLADFMGDEVDI